MIKSPMNYTGGKYKLLPQILPLFPADIETFIDLFCGGGNVGVNVEADRIVMNDIMKQVIDMYKYFQETDIEDVLEGINRTIREYKLSKVNAEGYYKLRSDYNEERTSLKLFVLICYAFNHQIRFNKSGGYNMPFGKKVMSYNKNIEKNLREFAAAIKKKNVIFVNESFEELNPELLGKHDFVYCDPPYLITTASYNENGGWNEEQELKLLAKLDELNANGVKFALSNVFKHKGRENKILQEWSKHYNVHYLNADYSKCSYHGKNTDKETVEVLITNYETLE